MPNFLQEFSLILPITRRRLSEKFPRGSSRNAMQRYLGSCIAFHSFSSTILSTPCFIYMHGKISVPLNYFDRIWRNQMPTERRLKINRNTVCFCRGIIFHLLEYSLIHRNFILSHRRWKKIYYILFPLQWKLVANSKSTIRIFLAPVENYSLPFHPTLENKRHPIPSVCQYDPEFQQHQKGIFKQHRRINKTQR